MLRMDDVSIAYKMLSWGILGGGLLVAVYSVYWHRRNPPDRVQCSETLASRAWDSRQLALLFCPTVGLYLLLSYCCSLLFPRETAPRFQLAILLSTYLAGLAIMQGIIARRDGSWAETFGTPWNRLRVLRHAPVCYLATIPFVLFATSIYHWALKSGLGLEITSQDGVEMIARKTSFWVEIAYSATAVAVAPFYEELVFRGILFPYALKRFGLVRVVVIVSTVFALMHMHIPSLASLFLLSSILCLAYWRSGSLWLPIGIHAIFNGITTLAIKLVY